jgi:hypothetical protein
MELFFEFTPVIERSSFKTASGDDKFGLRKPLGL